VKRKKSTRLTDLVNMQLTPSAQASYNWRSAKSKQSITRNIQSTSPSLDPSFTLFPKKKRAGAEDKDSTYEVEKQAEQRSSEQFYSTIMRKHRVKFIN